MEKLTLAALAVALALPTLAAVDAAAVYGAKCVACHAKDGSGSPVGKKLGAPDLKALKATDQQIAAAIENGKGKMSGFKGKLSAEEIAAVAKYVKAGLK